MSIFCSKSHCCVDNDDQAVVATKDGDKYDIWSMLMIIILKLFHHALNDEMIALPLTESDRARPKSASLQSH